MNIQGQHPDSDDTKRAWKIPRWVIVLAILLLGGFLVNMLWGSLASDNYTFISYNQFIELVDGGYVDQVQIEEDQILLTLAADADSSAVEDILPADTQEGSGLTGLLQQIDGGSQVYYTGRVEDTELVTRLMGQDVDFYAQITEESSWVSTILGWVNLLLSKMGIYGFV